MTYSYTSGSIRSNRLLSVSDLGIDGQNSSYTYDANGNILTDSKKLGTTTPIVYNELSLPSLVTITPTGKTLAYAYDATGEKLARTTKTGAVTNEIRIYDDGIEYTGTAGTTLDFVHTAEGRAVKSGSSYNYQYQITDHLGNVRAMFADANGNGVLTADEIIQFSDYYPFGREINYNVSLPLTPANNYKYNGKELQPDLSEYDYGARFYDPVIARWNVVDPMAETSRRLSPYNYAANNPIRNIDIDGMEAGAPDIENNNILDEHYIREMQEVIAQLRGESVADVGCCGIQGGNQNGDNAEIAKRKKQVSNIVLSRYMDLTIVDNGAKDPTENITYSLDGEPIKYNNGSVQNYILPNGGDVDENYPQKLAVFTGTDGNRVVFPGVSFTTSLTNDGGGFTPGTSTIHLSNYGNVNGLIDLEHEYGHFLDSQIRGLVAYTKQVSIPSIRSARTQSQELHLKMSFERRATGLAIKFFGPKSAIALTPSLYIKK